MIGRIPRPDERGEINALALPLIMAVLLLVAAIIFGAWAYSSREDYRKNTDEKIAAAVKVAKQEESVAKDKEHAEADKQPLKAYKGPEQYGGIQVTFPKTWSGYVSASDSSSQPLDGYFHPGVVPGVTDRAAAFALRVQVVSQSYASVVNSMKSQVSAKKVTAAPYAFPKLPKVVGTRFDGSLFTGKSQTGSMVVVPIRDKTLKVWTESPVYVNDYNTLILPNLTFSP